MERNDKPRSGNNFTRRDLGRLAAGAAGAIVGSRLVAPFVARAAGLEKELVFSSRGGSLGDAWRKSIIAPFEKKFDCRVTFITNDSVPALAKVVAQRNAPAVDVLWTTDQTHTQGRAQGIFEKLDMSRIPNAKDSYDFAVPQDGIGILWGVGGCAMGYNSEMFDRQKLTPPKSWIDLFDDSLKGLVAWLDFSTAQGINSFLMINQIKGGSEQDVDPGFSFLKEHLSQFSAILSSPAQLASTLEQRQALIAPNLDARFLIMQKKGFPLAIVYGKEGIPQISVILDLIKGAPHPNLAYEFINYALSKQSQGVVGNDMLLGPVNKTAEIAPEVQKKIVYGPERVSQLVSFDYATIAKNLPDWIGRWNREISL